jgi:flagellar motility protein MotE (MotC chaperone)
VFKLVIPLIFVLMADGQVEPPKGTGLFKTPPGAGSAEPRKRSGAGDSEKPAGESEKRPPRSPAAPPRVVDREPQPELGVREGGREAGRELPGRDVASVSRRPGAPPVERLASESERVVSPAAGLSANAMREELGQHASNQKAAGERERLEALSSDLARARSALREETARLEALMDKARQAGVIKPGAPGAAPGTSPPAGNGNGAANGSESGSAAMPVGDPMAPSAYFRPTPPPPSFAQQVEVVSKAIKSMKPEQAAGLIGHLERGLAAEVLQRMRSADAGAILGFLKPEVGAALAAEIVSRPPIKAKDADKDKP